MTGVLDVLLTLDDAARALGVSRRTLERRIAAGRIAAFRDGGVVRVGSAELQRYVASSTNRVSTNGDLVIGGRRLPPGEKLW